MEMRNQFLVLVSCATLIVACSGGGSSTPTPPGATAPNINVNPARIDFGSVSTTLNVSQTITVSNSGNATLTLGTITSPAAPFTRIGGSCANGQTLAVAANCTVIIQFAPAVVGVASSEFNFLSNDPDTGIANGQNNVLVSLTGTGTETKYYYTGASSATSSVGGLFSVSPSSPSVPAIVNLSAMAESPPAIRNAGVRTGTVNPLNGDISNYHQYAVVFAANGRLYKQYADQAPAPVQISNVTNISAGPGKGLVGGSSDTDLCYMRTITDYANPENTVVIYGQAGTNATCGDTDDNYFWLRLNTDTSSAPIALTDLPVAPVYSRSGEIQNFLVINIASSPAGALEMRNAKFSGIAATIDLGPFLVTANDKNIWQSHLSPTRILLLLPPAGISSTAGELRIADVSTNSLTAVRGTVGNRSQWWYEALVNDQYNVYFVSNDAAGSQDGIIQRFPIDGSVAASPFHSVGSAAITYLYLTANSVVCESNHGPGNFAITSVSKSNGTSTTLASSAPNEILALYGVSETGYVYFDRAPSIFNPATYNTGRAETVKDDNTGHVVYGAPNGAEWSGFHYMTNRNMYTSVRFFESLVVTEYAASATSIANATLSVVNPTTGTRKGTSLGTVPAGFTYLYGNTDGPRGLWIGFDGDMEVFYVDTAVAGPLTRVTNDSLDQQLVY